VYYPSTTTTFTEYFPSTTTTLTETVFYPSTTTTKTVFYPSTTTTSTEYYLSTVTEFSYYLETVTTETSYYTTVWTTETSYYTTVWTTETVFYTELTTTSTEYLLSTQTTSTEYFLTTSTYSTEYWLSTITSTATTTTETSTTTTEAPPPVIINVGGRVETPEEVEVAELALTPFLGAMRPEAAYDLRVHFPQALIKVDLSVFNDFDTPKNATVNLSITNQGNRTIYSADYQLENIPSKKWVTYPVSVVIHEAGDYVAHAVISFSPQTVEALQYFTVTTTDLWMSTIIIATFTLIIFMAALAFAVWRRSFPPF